MGRVAWRVGVIADTHGVLRPEALDALEGSDQIVHAGDIGSPEILDALEAIAPVTAVRGNVDRGAWARRLPRTAVLDVGGSPLYVLHDLNDLDLDPAVGGFAAVIAGHSHRPRQEERDGVLYFNPGSAGPRRFTLPVTVGRLTVDGSTVRAQIVTLAV
jgi:hypothetical protein